MYKLCARCRGILFLILILSVTLLLFGCNESGDVPTVKTGIEIEPSEIEPHSHSSEVRAKAVIFELLKKNLLGAEERELTEEEAEQLLADAERLRLMSVEQLISEDKYLAHIDLLEEHGGRLLSELSALVEGKADKASYDALSDIYLKLCAEAGADYVGRVMYGTCLYVYDQKYKEKMALYEKGGQKYYLVHANEIKANRDIFEGQIGAESFSSVIRLAVFFGKLINADVLGEESALGFTDAELLIFIKYPVVSDVKIGKDGYKLLGGYYCDMLAFADETSFWQELLYTACIKNPDTVFDVADELIALISSVQKKLTDSDVALMRDGKWRELVCSAASRFDADDWELFETVTTAKITKPAYDKVAQSFFGNDYEDYKTSITAVSLEELREAVGTDGFYNALEGYIFGRSPAFSYGMRDDRG